MSPVTVTLLALASGTRQPITRRCSGRCRGGGGRAKRALSSLRALTKPMITACVSQSRGTLEERGPGRGEELVTRPVAEWQPPPWAPAEVTAQAQLNPLGNGRQGHQLPLTAWGVSSRAGCGATQALEHHLNNPAQVIFGFHKNDLTELLIKGRAWQAHYYVYVKLNSAKRRMCVLRVISTHLCLPPTASTD